MKIEVNFDKKYFFLLVAILFISFGFAYNTNNPSSFGHSSGEIEVTLPNGQTTSLQQAITAGQLGNSSGAGSGVLVTIREGISSSSPNSVSCQSNEQLTGCAISCSGGSEDTVVWPTADNKGCRWEEPSDGSHGAACKAYAFCAASSSGGSSSGIDYNTNSTIGGSYFTRFNCPRGYVATGLYYGGDGGGGGEVEQVYLHC